jgi:hypothetical protein
MGPIVKVILAAGIGTVVGAYLEPKIVAHLPPSLQGGMAGKATHAAIAGVTAGGIFWVIKGA